MKKLILILTVAALALGAFSAVASDVSSVSPLTTVPTSVFRANEFDLSVGTAYTLGETKSTAFAKPYALNLNAGADYFFTRYLGVEANVPFYQNKAESLSDVYGGLVLRLPIKRVAPYVGFGYDYGWRGQGSTYVAKAGLEVRLVKHLGLYGEYQYRDNSFDTKGSSVLAGGLRLNF
jgi:hypothetical protein